MVLLEQLFEKIILEQIPGQPQLIIKTFNLSVVGGQQASFIKLVGQGWKTWLQHGFSRSCKLYRMSSSSRFPQIQALN